MTRHHMPRPWYRHPGVLAVAAAVCAGLAGLLLGALLGEPEQASTTRTVIETPPACVEALDGADRALAVALAFGERMLGLHASDGGVHTFERGGPHYQDSERFVTTITAAAEAFRQRKTACVTEGGGDRG